MSKAVLSPSYPNPDPTIIDLAWNLRVTNSSKKTAKQGNYGTISTSIQRGYDISEIESKYTHTIYDIMVAIRQDKQQIKSSSEVIGL